MTGLRPSARSGLEFLDTRPAVNVTEAEYRRLLGYPPRHAPGERADELAGQARQWYAEHGRPWVYGREVELHTGDSQLRLDGMEFPARPLHDHLQQAGAVRAVLVAACAGGNCEEQARRLWEEARPDEYFFLEMFGSAVVEQLVASLNGRICDRAERDGLMAVTHYSPGYTGWNVADQNRLFALIAQGMGRPWPEPMEVLSSGMLRPKKTQLAVIGLAPRAGRASDSLRRVPCVSCSFLPCQYRRAPCRPARARPL